jgi:hypothetical protein
LPFRNDCRGEPRFEVEPLLALGATARPSGRFFVGSESTSLSTRKPLTQHGLLGHVTQATPRDIQDVTRKKSFDQARIGRALELPDYAACGIDVRDDVPVLSCPFVEIRRRATK